MTKGRPALELPADSEEQRARMRERDTSYQTGPLALAVPPVLQLEGPDARPGLFPISVALG